MTKIDWATGEGGGRGIEIPYVRSIMSAIHGKVVADFGCMDVSVDRFSNKITTSVYGIPPDNNIVLFDICDVPNLTGQYNKVDFMTAEFYEKESIDCGVCVSVLEHIGLDSYVNSLNEYGDMLALANIMSTIKPGGFLIVTVPTSEESYKPLYWIRSYSPSSIDSWRFVASKLSISYDLFKKDGESWYLCQPSELKGVRHYVGITDINGVACVRIEKHGLT